MDTAQVSYTNRSFALDDFENEVWKKAPVIDIFRYWSGIEAEFGRRSSASLVWTDKGLIVRFRGNQNEPVVINSKPDTTQKAIGLWNRDVFEIFVAPNLAETEKYFEFETAPSGEWVDLAIRQTPRGRETDFDYHSGMKTAARVGENEIFAVMEIGWQAFGRKPEAGERWRGNLFRCVGAGETRGYLAWQPTGTELPNFHVPEAFGFMEFVK